MTLKAGVRLGSYEILGPLGVGGMGEVYRARDSRLGREVAVKILPAAFSRDPERLARFEREARLLATLNHPNIAAIYGLESAAGEAPFLVLELVEGETLAERIAAGPLPVPETLPLLRQVAEALEAAHEGGVIHRDLKPANVKVTPDGKVKLLDFGLAKAFAAEGMADGSRPDLSNSPTITSGETRSGIILGTVSYMSPEQARGKAIDKRTDIWAFGCLVYESLAGRKAFQGETVSDTLVAILDSEPDWAALPPRARPLEKLARSCLRKDPRERLRDIGDARIALDEAGNSPAPAATARQPRRRLGAAGWIAAALAALAIGAAAWWLRGRLHAASRPERVSFLRLTDFTGLEEYPAISPDGKSVAFTSDGGGARQIWVRLLAGGPPLQITHEPQDHLSPRWSPDSASLIYYCAPKATEPEGTIWEVSALGGAPRRITSAIGGVDVSHDGKRVAFFRFSEGSVELATAALDGSAARRVARLASAFGYFYPRWSPDDRVLAYQQAVVFDQDIYTVPAAGGEPRRVLRDGSLLGGFTWLPDGSGFVYSSSRGSTVLYLPTFNLWTVGLDGRELRQLTFGDLSYLHPDLGRGRLVASLMHMQFDLWRLPVDGEPGDNVRNGTALTHQTGNVQTPSPGPGDRELVYLSDSGGHGNLWVIRLDGNEAPRQLTYEQDPDRLVGVPAWSPDGKAIAFVVRPLGGWLSDLWLIAPDGSNLHKVAGNGWATWSQDAKWLYFAASNEGIWHLRKMPAAGGEVLEIRPESAQAPAVSPDGSELYFVVRLANVNGTSDLEIRAARPENADARVLARIPGSRIPAWQLVHPVISPDGKWLALPLTDRGVTNIWAVSTTDGALRPITDFGSRRTFIARRVSWSSDGKAVFAAVGEGDSDIVLLEGLTPSSAR